MFLLCSKVGTPKLLRSLKRGRKTYCWWTLFEEDRCCCLLSRGTSPVSLGGRMSRRVVALPYIHARVWSCCVSYVSNKNVFLPVMFRYEWWTEIRRVDLRTSGPDYIPRLYGPGWLERKSPRREPQNNVGSNSTEVLRVFRAEKIGCNFSRSTTIQV